MAQKKNIERDLHINFGTKGKQSQPSKGDYKA